METSFTIPSITCSICSGRIRNELSGMKGIENINTDLKSQSLRVTYNPSEIEPNDIGRKIASMGYEVIT